MSRFRTDRFVSRPTDSCRPARARRLGTPWLVVAAAITGGLVTTGCTKEAPVTPELTAKWQDESLWTIETRSLDGSPASLETYRGSVALVVNTASKCGFTPQYEGLQDLYDQFQAQGFVVLGFPSNDFMGQEPGTAEEIQEFCSTNFGITFPMFEKVVTKAGDAQSPVYEYLGTKTGDLPGWNFGKYLVGRDGVPIAYFGPRTKPSDADLLAQIEAALAAPQPSDA